MQKWAILSLTLLAALLLTSGLAPRGTSKQRLEQVAEPMVPVTGKAVAFAVSDPLPRDSKTSHRSAQTPQNENTEANAAFMPSPQLTFDGLSNYDVLQQYGVLFSPPDVSGDVGPDHYVQAVNSLFRVYSKSGAALTDPLKLSRLFSNLGTACSTRNDGEPIVLYDQLADRWLISQYCTAFPPFRQVIAVSTTPDPTGEYFLYEFAMPNSKLNDFSKFGVWPDGYYMSTEEFLGSDYVGAGAFAFEKAKMLAGDPQAGVVYFNLPQPRPFRAGGLQPSDFDGLRPPPANAPNVFVGYSADEYGEPADALRLFDFHVDWDQPLNSTFQERTESPLPVAPFDPTSPAGRADIAQPLPGTFLDSNSDRLSYRAAYRNFGDHQSLLVNQTVRSSGVGQPYEAGVRVYELENSIGAFQVTEQATLASPGLSRWIGTAAQDRDGNIAIGYNMSGTEKPPSIRYAGRLRSDPPGIYRQEVSVFDGTGVQKGFGFRWGDYSPMSVDPVDDCTFWLAGEYYSLESQQFSDFGWLTRIGKFKFDECTPAPVGEVRVTVVNAFTDAPVQNAAARLVPVTPAPLAAFERRTDKAGNTGTLRVLAGSYQLQLEARGFQEFHQDILVQPGSNDLTIRMRPIPSIEIVSSQVMAESCGMDHAANPGETLSLSVTFRNSGLINSAKLKIGIETSDTVFSSAVQQTVGIVLPGGTFTRTFTLTVSPSAPCGQVVELVFRVSDGRTDLGRITLPLPTGTRRVLMNENFDSSAALPPGWSSSWTGGQPPWTISSTNSNSPPNAAFSPATSHLGVNDLVTPEFFVTAQGALLEFQNYYDLESTFLRNRLFDGAVLEIRIADGNWQDILAAGGRFETGGYDGPIDSCCQNPLAGRNAWSGKSGIFETPQFVKTTVRLPDSAAGQNVRIRWRIATDNGTAREGQFIDDVLVTDGYHCNCALSGRIEK